MDDHTYHLADLIPDVLHALTTRAAAQMRRDDRLPSAHTTPRPAVQAAPAASRPAPDATTGG